MKNKFHFLLLFFQFKKANLILVEHIDEMMNLANDFNLFEML